MHYGPLSANGTHCEQRRLVPQRSQKLCLQATVKLELFTGHKRHPVGIVSPQIGLGTCESELQSGHPPNSAVMVWWPTVALLAWISNNRCKQTQISCCRCACTERVPTSCSC